MHLKTANPVIHVPSTISTFFHDKKNILGNLSDSENPAHLDMSCGLGVGDEVTSPLETVQTQRLYTVRLPLFPFVYHKNILGILRAHLKREPDNLITR